MDVSARDLVSEVCLCVCVCVCVCVVCVRPIVYVSKKKSMGLCVCLFCMCVVRNTFVRMLGHCQVLMALPEISLSVLL